MWELEDIIIAEKRPSIPQDTPHSYRRLIEESWAGQPSQRPTFTSICRRLTDIAADLCPNFRLLDSVTALKARKALVVAAAGMHRDTQHDSFIGVLLSSCCLTFCYMVFVPFLSCLCRSYPRRSLASGSECLASTKPAQRNASRSLPPCRAVSPSCTSVFSASRCLHCTHYGRPLLGLSALRQACDTATR